MGINSRALYQYLQEDLEAFDPEVRTDFLQDQTVQNVASGRLLDSFFKKLKDDPDPLFEANALGKFISINNRMKDFKIDLNTSLDEMLFGSLSAFLTDFFDQAMDSGRSWWTLNECFRHGRPGPGASIKAQGTDFYSKMFSSPLSTTDYGLFRHYAEATKTVPLWESAEFNRNSVWGHIVVPGNRLSFVPKTRLIARTICTEPNLNMFYQLGLGSMIEAELRIRYNIRFSEQPDHNRRFAEQGSIDQSYCTIDLSSASDTINWELLKKLIRTKSVIGLIERLRSPRAEMPNGALLDLHMVSTMGNGFTFPLQTLLFTGVVSVVMQSFGFKPSNTARLRNFGVFGDDIILPNFMFERATHFLQLLGFEVNRDKSFNKGAFRESCGSDFFNGRNVRGVYVRTLLTQQARYSLINRLNRWSAVHHIWLPRTVGYLRRSVKLNFIPQYEQDDAGIQVPLFVALPFIHRDRNWSFVYLRYVPRMKYLRVGDEKVVVPRRGKRRAFNYEGLRLTFLQGSLRDHRIGVRQDDLNYVYKAGIAPTWDYIPIERYPNLGAGERPLWEKAVCLNMIDDHFKLVLQV